MTAGPAGWQGYPNQQGGYPSPGQWPPQQPPNHSRAWIVGLAVATVVILVAVGVLIAWSEMDDEPRGGANADTVDFPTEPVKKWTVDVDEMTSSSSSSSFGSAEVYSRQPAARRYDDTVVVTVVNTDGDAPRLIGLDAGTGGVRWNEVGDVKACAGELVDGLIACIARTGSSDYGTGSTIVFRDVQTGRVVSQLAAAQVVGSIAVVDNRVITSGYAGSGSGRYFASGSTANLTEHWTVTRPINQGDCTGSGDLVVFVADSEVIGAGNGVSNQYVRTSDGSPVIEEDLAWTSYQPGVGFTGLTCQGTSSYTLKVFDADGELLRTHPAESWTQGIGAASSAVSPAPYIAGGDVLDFETGERLWPADVNLPVSSTNSYNAELVGDVLLVLAAECGTCGRTTTALDVGTGETLWKSGLPDFSIPHTWVTDGTRIMVADSGRVTATDLRTGSGAWSLGYSDGPVDAKLYRVGGGFLIVTADELTYVEPQ